MIRKKRIRIKKYLYGNFMFRAGVGAVYSLIVSSELFVQRVMDLFYSRPGKGKDYSNVTAVIKTFERPRKLKRLLKSIKRTFPDLKIVIVDDSKYPITIKDANTTLVILPFDSGVSAGRAAGLEEVTTPYVINLDDDFVFSRKTELTKATEYLEKNRQVDIVAGEVVYLPYYIRFDYTKHRLMDYSSEPLHEKGAIIGGLKVYEKCANFFIARTEKLKSVGWDSSLKRLDHADFFTRARGKVTTVFCPNIELLHDPTHFDTNYLKIRHDYSQDSFILNKRYPSK